MRGKTAKLLRQISQPPYPNPPPRHMRAAGVYKEYVRAVVADRRRLIYKLAKQLWKKQPMPMKSVHVIVWDIIHATSDVRDTPAAPVPATLEPLTDGVREALKEKKDV